jgi:hypothetical protein
MLREGGWRTALSTGGREGLPWSMERYAQEDG